MQQEQQKQTVSNALKIKQEMLNKFDPLTENQKKFFDAWLNWINPTINYNLKYKADYAIPLTINQYDVKNELSYSVTMLDAFPIAVNQLDLDWSSDGHHKLTVTFSYTSWRDNSLEALGMELLETTIANSLFNSSIQRESLLGRDLIQAPFETRQQFEDRLTP
jgi:hypothetical protein